MFYQEILPGDFTRRFYQEILPGDFTRRLLLAAVFSEGIGSEEYQLMVMQNNFIVYGEL
jgi:hypothetical protein